MEEEGGSLYIDGIGMGPSVAWSAPELHTFVPFQEFLTRVEDLLCDVVDRVLKSPYGHLVKELNPEFKAPK